MKKLSLLLMASLIQLTNCNVQESSEPKVNEEQIEENVTSTIHKIFEACKKKNFTALESYHINTPKFSIFKEDGSPQRLTSQQNNEIVKNELSALQDVNFELSDLNVVVVQQMAVATFILHVDASLQNTKIKGSNRATFVFVEDQGSWKVLHEHFSAVIESAK